MKFSRRAALALTLGVLTACSGEKKDERSILGFSQIGAETLRVAAAGPDLVAELGGALRRCVMVNREARAALSERGGDGAPETAAPTGHQRHTSTQLHVSSRGDGSGEGCR